MDLDRVHFWAKTTPDGRPGISTLDHCINVGCVSEALVKCLPSLLAAKLPPGVITLAAAHDVGKVSPGFQAKCAIWIAQNNLSVAARQESWANCEPDHARVSQWFLQNCFGAGRLNGWAAIVGAHHGRIKGRRLGPMNIGQTGGPMWEQARRRLMEKLTARFGALPDTACTDDALLWYVAGLITVADWIGSDERFFPPERGRQEDAPDVAQRAILSIGWGSPRFHEGSGFAHLFPSCRSPRPLQAAALSHIHNPGLYLIEAQMGSGKTEAALAAAYQLVAGKQAAGLYFALPTQVTSNRIYERVAAFLALADAEPDGRRLRLAHSTSWLREEQPPPTLHPAIPNDAESSEHASAGRSWFASSKRALLAPYGVGTIDQALLSVVAAKHFFVRQFGIAGKVVILDEVHTYDLYTGTLLDVLIRRLRELHCTVIILSATLTADRRRELIALSGSALNALSDAYPLLTACPEKQTPQEIAFADESPKSISVETTSVSTADLADQLLARASAGQCVLWVRNTVREAQETFRFLRNSNREGGPRLGLLHSRFPQFRREQLESEWLRCLGKDGLTRPVGCILVATQVVEQSVDIDADFLVSDLAPTDMLLQRIGRLWRHERKRPSGATPAFLLHIPAAIAALDLQQADASQLKNALGPSGYVYAPYVLLRSLSQWRERPQITLPSDIRPVLEATYRHRGDEPPGWNTLREQLEHAKEKLRQLALNNTNVWNQPALADDEGVQTRFNSRPSAQLLLANSVEPQVRGRTRVFLLNGESPDMDHREWSLAAAKAIHWNLVRVPRYAVVTALHTAPDWLRLHVQGDCALGLVRDGSVFWPESDVASGLGWHPDEGVTIAQQRPPAISRNLEDDYESYD